ncbi:glycosyltransferase [Flavobacterium sp. NG2]|uniref:glycosyltransferase n=1 Tax=Flavobacterium sp. NG2 TaxID=3097547 RepID=UPI002A7EDEFB|nr:glycosyltransferase [Flavobacterium sp. NG2]WPR71612.1 glycosyltransferase [Flavobacterium sp. NG2]
MIAIVIPYFKHSFFEANLQSLANQTDKRFKVYIGDDASKEPPIDLLKKYKGQFDFVYHRFEKNLGGKSLIKQWERCVSLTHTEEWLMVLGDDDLLGKNVVKEFYSLIETKKKEEIDLIRFRVRTVDENNIIHNNDFLFEEHETAHKLLDRMFSIKETITASEFIFSREIYNRNNGFVEFPLGWFSDYASWLLFASKTGIFNIQTESVYWRISGINISSKSTDFKTIRLKVKSLFMFMFFLQNHFVIDKMKQKAYVFNHLITLLRGVNILAINTILIGQLLENKFHFLNQFIIQFIFKKNKEKAKRVYGYICSARKG